ncbi:MAG: phosphatidylglycerophosphatase A [Sedimentisphaerales bacterium]|jgi:phosphatidylglycerophosphatase A|nr:phosphatidylglycerophosphatase A [Sedimentisphaerales bacterium]
MDTRRWLAAGLGLGWLPLAPGSWGSLLPAGVFAAMGLAGCKAMLIAGVQVVLALLGAVGCVWLSPYTISLTGSQDPDEVVLDEVAGQAICLLGVMFCTGPAARLGVNQVLFVTCLGYLCFRLFDTIKPWPCRPLERLPTGWGILADDLVAGLYALICLALGYWIWY